MKQSTNRGKRLPSDDNIATFKAPEDGALLSMMPQLLPDHKATKLKSMLRRGQFAVNGQPQTQFNYPIRRGDTLQVNFDRAFITLGRDDVKIVYQDADLLVISKPAGMLATPGRGKATSRDTAFDILLRYVQKLSSRAHLYVVHRLDRETSGLMLLARSARCRDVLVKQWEKLVLQRKFHAVVEGCPDPKQGRVSNFLYEDPNDFSMHSTRNPQQGRRAVTQYTVLQGGQNFSLVELDMRTGQKHQLRIHMQDLGTPISGDSKYGGHRNAIARMALHATALQFIHPVSNERITLTDPTPEEFNTLLNPNL